MVLNPPRGLGFSEERGRARRDGRPGMTSVSPGRALPPACQALEPLRVLGSRRGLGRCGLLVADHPSRNAPNHGERRPSVAAVRRRDCWVWSPRTRPVCRSPLHPLWGSAVPCVRTGAWRAYSGGNWMVASAGPVRRARVLQPGEPVSPLPARAGYPAGALGPAWGTVRVTNVPACPFGGIRVPGGRFAPRPRDTTPGRTEVSG
jgi:hypothetical protein